MTEATQLTPSSAPKPSQPEQAGSSNPQSSICNPQCDTRRAKIARLPFDIRQQINHRIRDGEPAPPIADWLNSIPEVRAVLDSHFKGCPVTKSNISRWKLGGYRDWLAARDTQTFLAGPQDALSLPPSNLPPDLTPRLLQSAAFHYSACAQAVLSPDAVPEDRLQFLRKLCSDISRLRRAELQALHLELKRQFHADRLDLDRQWLALEQDNSRQKTDAEFWTWTKRADIKDKLHPPDQGGITDATRRKVESEFRLFPRKFLNSKRKRTNPIPAQFRTKPE